LTLLTTPSGVAVGRRLVEVGAQLGAPGTDARDEGGERRQLGALDGGK
jgi:hypothetical protein